MECDDLFEGAHWDNAAFWLRADEKDKPYPYLGYQPQLYNVNAVGYESLMLGAFDIHYGPENDVCASLGVPKITEIQPMFSRDGYHFSRPRKALINASINSTSWDRGYVKAAAGGVIIHGDELWFYYSAFKGDEENAEKCGLYTNGATGLAKLRRDGFISMDGNGRLLTRKIIFTDKKELHINAEGSVSVKIIDENGTVTAKSSEFNGDSTNARLSFDDFDIASVNGRPIRLEFEVHGSLYSFGFTDDNGDFGGAHAAGICQ